MKKTIFATIASFVQLSSAMGLAQERTPAWQVARLPTFVEPVGVAASTPLAQSPNAGDEPISHAWFIDRSTGIVYVCKTAPATTTKVIAPLPICGRSDLDKTPDDGKQ